MEVASLKTAFAVFVQVPETIENTEVVKMVFQVLALDLSRVDQFEEREERNISDMLSAHLKYILSVN